MEDHIEIITLEKKIDLLFKYRLFPELFQLTRDNEANIDKFNNQLIDLQKSIYLLDAHMEANWEVDESKLAYHWESIKNNLLTFGITAISPYVNHIHKYQKHELDLRLGKLPMRFDMEYFYFYKSCDVKLLRRLIYEQYGLARQLGPLSVWRYYDLITEVNDDVEDLYEDIDFFNGNSFLLSILKFGKDKTLKNFSSFIDIIELKSKGQKLKLNIAIDIPQLTALRIAETRDLLTDRIANLDLRQLEQAKIKHAISKVAV